MTVRMSRQMYAPDGGGAGSGAGAGGGTPPAPAPTQGNPPAGDGGTPPAPRTWDSVLAELTEADRALYEQHTMGLANTVRATRQERDTLATQLSELTKALGKNDPEAAKALLAQMTADLEMAGKRAQFAEEAVKPEIGCTNPKAAFLVAQADGLFDSRGNPDWNAIKGAAPELFRKATPAGNAGTGTQTPPAGGGTMNDWIRRAAGRS